MAHGATQKGVFLCLLSTDLVKVLAAEVCGGVGGLSGQRRKVVPAARAGAEVVGYPDHGGRGLLVPFDPGRWESIWLHD